MEGVTTQVQMDRPLEIPARFDSLPLRRLFGIDFPVAKGPLARLRGLSLLEPEAAGPGLLIPRCRSVHTLGMRFPIDVVFLDRQGVCLSVRRRVGPGRVVSDRRAESVLESVGLLDLEWAGRGDVCGGRESIRRD